MKNVVLYNVFSGEKETIDTELETPHTLERFVPAGAIAPYHSLIEAGTEPLYAVFYAVQVYKQIFEETLEEIQKGKIIYGND